MTATYVVLGLVLVIVSIPFGLMLAPLAIGGILLWLGLRRMDRAMQPGPTGEPA